MKFTPSIAALVAILGLALASIPVTVQAQTPAPSTTPAPAKPKAKKADKIEYKGTLTVVDTTGNTITVSTSKKDPTKVLVLKIVPSTKILKDKAPATLADFAVGQTVSGSYTKDSTGLILTAASLHLKTAKAPTTATAPVKPATPAAQ